jgi:uncharacterized protein YndB with AHSA1/START domain
LTNDSSTGWRASDEDRIGLAGRRVLLSLIVMMPGGQAASGAFVEFVPHTRIVLTWGWEGEATPVLPGGSAAIIEFEPNGAGTLLRLTHTGLAPPPVAEHHRAGWERYVERLRERAEGGDPGPDDPEMRN